MFGFLQHRLYKIFFAKNSSDKFNMCHYHSIFHLFSLWTNSLAFCPPNFRHSSTLSASIFFAKIVLINSLGGATVTYAAYTTFRRISVRFRRFNKVPTQNPMFCTRSR